MIISRLQTILATTVLSGLLLTSLSSVAKIEVKFGPEFTFFNPSLTKNNEGLGLALKNYKDHLIVHLVNNQPKKAKFDFNAIGDLFTSPNGWYFHPTLDMGVIEVTTKPMTVADWEKYASDIQDAIFVSAYNNGLYPGLYIGGGHINIGLEPFYKNPILLRNFIVDFWNHNELSLGIMNYDTNNAAPLSMLKDSSIKDISLWLERFDAILLGSRRNLTRSRILEHLAELSNIIYYSKSWMGRAWRSQSEIYKYIDLNFGNANQNRIELRSVRAQQNISTWINQIKLIQGRIDYLESLGTELIPLRFKLTVQQPTNRKQQNDFKLNPPVPAQEALKLFYTYVTESGQSWRDHRDYIWPQWIRNGSLRRFENSKWFLAQQKSCGALL